MSTPATIWLVLAMLSIALAASLSGRPVSGKFNGAIHIAIVLANFGLLYWGGFFASVPA